MVGAAEWIVLCIRQRGSADKRQKLCGFCLCFRGRRQPYITKVVVPHSPERNIYPDFPEDHRLLLLPHLQQVRPKHLERKHQEGLQYHNPNPHRLVGTSHDEFITSSSSLATIILKQGKSGLRPHDLLPLLQSPIFMLPSKLEPFFFRIRLTD
uniref:Uncharacterized protein n=1 Tax=Acanthochromis polyacanthus TaxID=80966 RepID=A0A3Q1EUL2_9TELE